MRAAGYQPPNAIQEAAIREALRERWPGAGFSVASVRPTSTPGNVVWTVWRDLNSPTAIASACTTRAEAVMRQRATGPS